MNSKVDAYLADGCGRCALYQTAQCKVHSWTEELIRLRRIVLDCGLQETFKWSQPCYTFNGKNVLMVTAFKEYAALAFFKGVLLKDDHNILIQASESSQAGRQIRYRSVREILEMEAVIKAYIHEAIGIEKAGLTVHFAENPEPRPQELQDILNENAALRSAFEALTPGRQRGYILYFSKAKQSKTRRARIEKCIPNILKGEGLHDRYTSRRK